jgi:hypothetical protein
MGEGLGLLPNRALSASVRRPSANDESSEARRVSSSRLLKYSISASFHLGRNLALQFAPAGPQTSASSVEPSGGFQNASERWIVIQREQKCKAIQVCAETMPPSLPFRPVRLAALNPSAERAKPYGL